MDTMQRLTEYSLNRPPELSKLRAKETKVIGYFAGDFIPEELLLIQEVNGLSSQTLLTLSVQS